MIALLQICHHLKTWSGKLGPIRTVCSQICGLAPNSSCEIGRLCPSFSLRAAAYSLKSINALRNRPILWKLLIPDDYLLEKFDKVKIADRRFLAISLRIEKGHTFKNYRTQDSYQCDYKILISLLQYLHNRQNWLQYESFLAFCTSTS